MPRVTLCTDVDGREECLSEYICDWPDCPNVAEEIVGSVAALRVCMAMCSEHARQFARESKEKKDAQRR